MEHIHQKSALADTTRLLQQAYERGTDLLWERHERQLPLCGFTSNGLSCRKCFEGPCRINPFGEEPSQGVCGADRDQIVMENLFQATLAGVMESARIAQMLGGGEHDIPDITSALPAATVERLSRQALLPVRKSHLFSVRNSYFSHKGYLLETLRDLTRLGLVNYGLLRQGEHRVSRPPLGQPGFHPDGVTIFIAGHAPAALVEALEQHGRAAEGVKINLVGEGGSAVPYLRAGIDRGSPELALAMGVDALVITPDAAWPALPQLAARYGVPVAVVDGGRSYQQFAAEVVGLARGRLQTGPDGGSGRMAAAPDARSEGMLDRGKELAGALEAGRIRGVAVILGEPSVKQTFFARTLHVMEACLAQRAVVLLGGELGAHADVLAAELRARRGEQLAAFGEALRGDGLRPVSAFGSSLDLPRVISLLARLPMNGAAKSPKAIAVFPEFFRTSTWASAVTFLALGFPVQVGIRLPFWGSPALVPVITEEWPRITGAKLLTGPVVPDAPAQAEEIAAFFQA